MATAKDTSAARKRAAKELSRGFGRLGTFLFGLSGVINVLALTGAFYMLQIYDRVLTSGSVPTLVALSLLAIGLYAFQGVFDVIRTQILVRVGARLDDKVAPLAHRVAIDMPRLGFSTTEALERGRDVDTVRGFLGSQGPSALFDLPWIPLYLGFVYLLHPWLGTLNLIGALVLVLLTLLGELLTRGSTAESRSAAIARNAIADSNARNADTIKAMGFAAPAVARFEEANRAHLALAARSSDVTGTLAAFSRVLRMLLQSALLGLGAYLTLQGQLSAGAIIACSVASARALAPVDLAIGNWRSMVAARQAFGRLRDTVAALASASEPMDFPLPHVSLSVEKLTVAAPASGQVLLTDVAFKLSAGDGLGIIGPSGGGKTTLVRALTGVWPSLRGHVRLDGADLAQWREETLGRALGYLPQEVGLLDATVEENIARLDPEADPAKVVAAAKAAGVHDLIVRLPEGYKTRLGPQGASLSAGQRQRIGLARALYGDPFLVVLDEPNSNLDAEGEAALSEAIRGVRERGGIVIVVAHRPSALANLDLVAVVQNGKLAAFGPKDQVLAPVTAAPHPAHQAPAHQAPAPQPAPREAARMPRATPLDIPARVA